MREVAIEQKKVYSNDAWLGPTSAFGLGLSSVDWLGPTWAVGLVPLSVVELV